MMLRRFFLCSLFIVTACAGKTLDVGERASSSNAIQSGSPEGETDTPRRTGIGAITGVWVMVRQDGLAGVPDDGPVPHMELDISPSGVAYRSTCARAPGEKASAPCPPESTSNCLEGTARQEENHWRLALPIGAPDANYGEARFTTDGLLMVDYVNPTFSAGYFRRLEGTGLAGGCRP